MESQTFVQHEPRWHASLAVLAALILYVTLPPRLTIGPTWVAPLIVMVIMVPLLIFAPRRNRETRRTRVWGILLIAIVNFYNIVSVLLLINGFFHPVRTAEVQSAANLLRHGLQIWFTNILVFALWYWELDGDGPDARAHASAATEFENADFLFPQMQVSIMGGGPTRCFDPLWKPQFFDYLYLSFTNSTAFSPTDTLPLSAWAKMLMLAESATALVTIAVVAARAVNILGQ